MKIRVVLLVMFLAVSNSVLASPQIVLAEKPKPGKTREQEGVHAEERKSLTPDEQASFLTTRNSGGMIGRTFSSYGSFLYAVHDVAIHSDSKEANQTSLTSPFPDFYKPTWREIFDSIARQTKSSWKYDPKRDYWVFAKPAMPVPFTVKLAKGWKSEDRGSYVFHGPPSAPVGMDVYVMGTYSDSEKKSDLSDKVRKDIALRFARGFKKDVTTKEMSRVKVGKCDALHFKISAPRTGIIWRQWIVVDSAVAIAIVSAVKPEHEKQILPDVETMLKSFALGDARQEAAIDDTELKKILDSHDAYRKFVQSATAASVRAAISYRMVNSPDLTGFHKHSTLGSQSAWYNGSTREVLVVDSKRAKALRIAGFPKVAGHPVAAGWEKDGKGRFYVHVSPGADTGTMIYFDLKKKTSN